jgi:chromosome segregation ATPase
MSVIEDINNLIIKIRTLKNKIVIVEDAIKDSDNQEILKDIDELIKFIPICRSIKDSYVKLDDDNLLLTSENKNLNKEVQDRINEIVKLKNSNEDLTKKMENQHEETLSLLKDYETIENMIDILTARSNTLVETVKNRDNEINDKNLVIENMMKKIDELNNTIKNKEEELNKINKELEDKLKMIVDKNIEITGKGIKIDELNDIIIQSADDYVMMKAKYNETITELTKITDLNKKKDDIIEELRNINLLVENERDSLKERIEFKMKEIKILDDQIHKLTKHKCHIL